MASRLRPRSKPDKAIEALKKPYYRLPIDWARCDTFNYRWLPDAYHDTLHVVWAVAD